MNVADRGPLPERATHALGHLCWPLNNALSQTTAAVAIFDRDLRCRASNEAFASMTGATVHNHLGRTFEEMLGAEVPPFHAALLHVWKSKETLREQRITFKATNDVERRCLADFFPIEDVAGCVQMLGTTFSELTVQHRIERRLHQLTGGSQNNGEGASETSENGSALPGCVELMEQTVRLLNRSMAIRRAITEVRLASNLRHYSLMLAAENLIDALAVLRARRLKGARDAHAPALADQSVGGPNEPSPREMQVVRFLAEGKSNKEIAYFLSLSTRTVETYRSRLMAKLKVHSAAEIVRYAIRHNLIEA